MKKLALVILAPVGLLFCGCVSGSGTKSTVYAAPLFGDPVGNIICIEDKEHNTLIYKYVTGTGSGQMKVLVKNGSDWHDPED
jgi:hypothetical protein